jgi:hypothetical protein
LTAQVNSITTGHSATPAEHLAYAHATLGSPTISCLTTAVEKGFLPNMPRLNKAALQKYPPHTVATAKGHLDQSRKNKHSTKTNKLSPLLQITAELDDDPLTDAFLTAEPSGLATQAIYVDLWDAATGKIFSDLTGRLPVPSSRGNIYIFLLYDYDSNSINV